MDLEGRELIDFASGIGVMNAGHCQPAVVEAIHQQAKKLLHKARDMTFKFGEELRELGYRGYFELDFLRDLDSDELYLGEVNPRVTGASAMTNLATCRWPRYCLHLGFSRFIEQTLAVRFV